jgi:hypothetical protein
MGMLPLLGPILLIRDVAWENQITGVVACLLLVACMAVALLRPRLWTIGLAGLAGLAWLLIGVIGAGIDC